MEIQHGIDITSVRRIQESIERQGDRFLEKVFTREECAYCDSNRRKYEHYAARFAAKEALLKAVRSKRNYRFCFKQIEIKRQPTGKPYLCLTESLRKRFSIPKDAQIELSLAHERDYAVATVVIVIP